MTDREKLTDLIREAHKQCKAQKDCHVCEVYGNGSDCVYMLIANHLIANGVEAAPVVHGRWEDFCGGKMCCCSACKAEFDNTCNEIHGEWKFCPNCGAKMDGGVSDG